MNHQLSEITFKQSNYNRLKEENREGSYSPIRMPSMSSKKTVKNESSLQVKRRQVIALKENNQLNTALQLINELIRQYPTDIRSQQLKGELAFGLKMFEESSRCYEELIRMSSLPENTLISNQNVEVKNSKALYYFNQGICLQKLGKHLDAIFALKESIRLNKSKVESYVCLAECYRSVRNIQKMEKILDRLIEKNPHNFEIVLKAIKLCKQEQRVENTEKFIEIGLQNWFKFAENNLKSKTVFVKLLTLKADLLKSTGRYQLAIQQYLKITAAQIESNSDLIETYIKMAVCYDNIGKFDTACQLYTKVLTLNPKETNCLNNLSNLQIRRGNFLKALEVLNVGIIQCKSKMQSNVQQILMICHRIIVFVNINKIQQAQRDLATVIKSFKSFDCDFIKASESQDNFKFIKYVIDKYQKSISQLQTIKTAQKHQNNQQIQSLQKQLLSSISKDLQSTSPASNTENLQKLMKRIDNLHKEIINFKNNTLKEHENHQEKVHSKISQIQEIVIRKEEERCKLEQQMQQMRTEYSDIYKMVDGQIRNQKKEREFSKILDELKREGRDQVANYIQQFYWIFNAYLISTRLIANDLVARTENKLHLNKVSAFFVKFKNVFQAISHFPHLGIFCDSINALLSFYLNEQANHVYQTLNTLITKMYYTQQGIQRGLERALIKLVESKYIDDILNSSRKDKITCEMEPSNKGQIWFRRQKNKILSKILTVEVLQQKLQDKVIKDIVVEDISALLVYMVKNKQQLLATSLDLLNLAVHQTLVAGFKKDEIMSLYARDSNRQSHVNLTGEGCSSKCQIYTVFINKRHELSENQISNKNAVLDELIKDSIEQNNIDLFLHAVSQLDFNFF